jgi:RimJ/RimL family protein N-acetyltransferase
MGGLLPDQNPDGENYAVFIRSDTSDHENGPMIGVIGVFRSSPVAELGYTLHPSVWGRGYATEAVSEFIKRFWELRPTVDRIIAKTDGENFGSMKVLKKCGFQEIERAREEISLPLLGTGMREVVTFEINAPFVS